MRLPSVSYIFNSLLGATRRFPLPVLLSIFVTASSIFLLENEDTIDEYTWLFKALLACAIFFPLFIAFVARKEATDSSIGGLLIANVVGVLLMIAYWYFMAPDPESYNFTRIARFLLFGVITHLTATFLPYLQHGDLDNFWEYNRRLFINFFIGALYSFLIFGGLALGLTAIKVLFDIDFDYTIYSKIWFVCTFFVHPVYFLSNFPKAYQYNLSETRFDRPFVNLIKYVFISLVALYMVILYAYGSKILFTWELPEGWVARLVLGFSVAGVLTYLLNYMLPKIEQSGWVKNYRKWFFYVLLPVTGLLFIAIWRRISDYGITEERYFVLLLGIWLAAICLYFIISKKDDIRYIPISLALFALVAAVGGPLSAFSVSKKSQKNRLTNALTEANILVDGKIEVPDAPYDGEHAAEITSIVTYLANHGHISALSDWIDISQIQKDYDDGRGSKNVILDELGVKSTKTKRRSKYLFYFYAKEADKLEISDYEYFSRFNIGSKKDGFHLLLDDSKILFKENENLLENIDIEGLMKILQTDFGDKVRNPSVEQMSHFHNGENYDVLISFQNLSFANKNEVFKIKDGNGSIFWRKK